MPRESTILKRARLALIRAGGKCVKTEGEGEPDLICCVGGRTVVVETKQPGKKPEPLQRQRLREWRSAGALAYWTDDAETFRSPDA